MNIDPAMDIDLAEDWTPSLSLEEPGRPYQDEAFHTFENGIKRIFMELRYYLAFQLKCRGPMVVGTHEGDEKKAQALVRKFLDKLNEEVSAARKMVEMVKTGLEAKYEELVEEYDGKFGRLLESIRERDEEMSGAAGEMEVLKIGTPRPPQYRDGENSKMPKWLDNGTSLKKTKGEIEEANGCKAKKKGYTGIVKLRFGSKDAE